MSSCVPSFLLPLIVFLHRSTKSRQDTGNDERIYTSVVFASVSQNEEGGVSSKEYLVVWTEVEDGRE